MNNSYRFNVGDFECLSVSDGFYTYAPPQFPPPEVLLFSNPSPEFLAPIRVHYKLPSRWTEWISPYICLLINTGKYLVLIDTGAGNLAPTTGKLIQNLRSENISPEDIDIVINTHGHPDHLGGNTDTEGQPAFPAARYVISKDEWDFWTSIQAEQKIDEHSRGILVGTARKNLLPLKSRIDLVDDGAEIVQGISTIAAPGHTPGLMALAVSSKKEQLLCISDVVLHPVHMEMLDWVSVFDVVPGQVATSRRKLFEMASMDKSLVMAFHFPFPGLGYAVRKGESWGWQPLK